MTEMVLETAFGISIKPLKNGIHINVTQTFGSRYSDWATGRTIRRSNPDGARDFLPLRIFQPAPTQWIHTVSFPEERRPEREADNPSPSRAKVKNELSYTSTPQYAFILWTRYIYFYILPPTERVVFITNSNLLVFTEIIGFGIYRENHRKYTNTRSDGKKMVRILATLL
jgi:hypothetical protein